MPKAWASEATKAAQSPSVTTAEPTSIAKWWTHFDDPMLTQLVEQALGANLDLQQARSRVRQARAARGVAEAGLWPSVGSSASAQRSASGPTPRTSNLFQAGLDASWELDVFGGLRRGVEAADADIQAAIEDERDVQVSLAAEVALDYIELRGFQRQIAIAQQNLDAQQHTADVTRRRQGGGFASRLDVANAEAQVATTRSQIPLLEAQAQQRIYLLGILLAREPDALSATLRAPRAIPAVPPKVPVGVPSDLLLRRPDLRRALADLHGATARIGVATADLYPRFSLTGAAGFASNQLHSLWDWVNRFWSVGSSLTFPIFEAGAITANIEAVTEVEKQALLEYRKTLLNALGDVESALVAYGREQEHREALEAAVTANRKAVEVSTQLYTAGQIEFLNLLDAQRSLFASEDALVQSNRAIATDLVALYKALGGGWELVADGSSTRS